MPAESAVAAIIQQAKQPIDPLFTPVEAAEYLGVSVDTLSVWRCVGRYDLQYVKTGRLVRYRKSALEGFLDRRTHGAGV